MRLYEFMDMCGGEKSGPVRGNWSCACPVCERGRSDGHHLQVAEGSDKLLIRCNKVTSSAESSRHVDDILAELGLKKRDLYYEPIGDAPKRSSAKRQSGTLKVATGERVRKRPYDVTRVYEYRDAHGGLAFCVERRQYTDAKGGKTFLQYHEDNGRKDYKDVSRYYGDILYHLPQLIEGITQRRPVFVVEGEKDVENLERIGFVATCNVGGAGIGWKSDYNHHFSGADVIVIADNDPIHDENGNPHAKGQKHARNVASNIDGVASRVRLCDNLRDYCPTIPDKGDISDLIEIEGEDARNVILRIMRETPVFNPNEIRSWENHADRVGEMYAKVDGYSVEGGCVWSESERGKKMLANFVAVPTTIVTRDDGVNVSKEILIDGWTCNGDKLPTSRVKAQEFVGMGWVTRDWDMRANYAPGSTVKDRLRYVITEVGNMNAKRVVEYAHTGWRRIGGEWCYLYNGGAIGADNVTVNLGSGLERFRLDGSGAEGWQDISYTDAASATMSLMQVVNKRVSIPLLGTIFLASMRQWMEMGGTVPAFALFLLGGTGTGKSTAEALALSHYGDFNYRTMPASFKDTANYIQKKAFLLKDMPIVVDDYHPVTSIQERKRMETTAQALARAFGDNASRGRMAADLTLQSSMPPRGIAIMSGEDVPNLGESGLARFYIVNVKKDDIPKDDMLTGLQELAHKGYMARTMEGFITWQLKQTAQLPDRLNEEFMRNRSRATREAKGQHARAAEAIAYIMVGYDAMLRYFKEIGAIGETEVYEMSEEAWATVTMQASRQAAELREERPSRMFLETVKTLLLTKVANVQSINGPTDTGINPQTCIGYSDEERYYFLPKMVYPMICQVFTKSGEAFPLSEKGLWKQMREDGLLAASGSKGNTRQVTVKGARPWCIWIRRSDIDDGFTEMEDLEIPKEMK